MSLEMMIRDDISDDIRGSENQKFKNVVLRKICYMYYTVFLTIANQIDKYNILFQFSAMCRSMNIYFQTTIDNVFST
jgi:hypothetical protein